VDKHTQKAIKKFLESTIASFDEKYFVTAQRLQEGVFRIEQRLNGTWNLFSVLIRLMEHVGLKQGWWKDRAEFQAIIQKLSDELREEVIAVQKKEIERIQREQAEGKEPEPMRAGVDPLTDAIKLVEPEAEPTP